MKTKLSRAIAMATLVGAAASAQAGVEVNHEGVAGALLYPVYTVNNENSTLVSVTNTTGQYKAVKVRFLEGKNSVEVLDFHLYLSPYDVWSGSIVATENGAKVMSKDTSCVAGFNDGFPAEGLEFRMSEIDKDSYAGDNTQPAGVDLSEGRVRVGHFEVIEMGVVHPDLILTEDAGGRAIKAGPAIKHVNGVPGNCAAITTAWEAGGVWEGNTSFDDAGDRVTKIAGMGAPTGGLYGTAAIVNVPGGWAASYDAVAVGDPTKTKFKPADTVTATDLTTIGTPAVAGDELWHTPASFGKNTGADILNLSAKTSSDANAPFWNEPMAGGGLWAVPQHPRPGSVYPSLDTLNYLGSALTVSKAGEVGYLEVRKTTKAPIGSAAGTTVQETYGVTRVSNALKVASVYNDYYIKQALNAETDMVISFPTKRFHVNITPGEQANPGADYVRGRTAPFTNGWNLSKNKSCEEIAVTYYDKEERKDVVEVGMVSPRPTEPRFSLCYETNILSVGPRSDVLGGKDLRQQFNVNFSEGWFAVTLAGSTNALDSSKTTFDNMYVGDKDGDGLPLIGFSTIVTKNGNVGGAGVLANYAQTFKNKTN